MTKNWKLIAQGNGVPVPAGELEKFAPSLNALEEAFRPLAATIPLEIEPSITLSEDAVISRCDLK
jgi:hypothetical protein